MEIFIALVVGWLLVKNGVTDVAYAAKGQLTPRTRLAMKALDAYTARAKARGEKPSKWSSGRHAVREWGSALLNDAFDGLRERHDIRTSKRSAKRRAKRDAFESGKLAPRWIDRDTPTSRAARQLLNRGRSRYATGLERMLDRHDRRVAERAERRTERQAHRENRRRGRKERPLDPGPAPTAETAPSSEGQDQTPTPDPSQDEPQVWLMDPEGPVPPRPWPNRRSDADFLDPVDLRIPLHERTVGNYECNEPDCEGHQLNPELRTCPTEGCDGHLVPIDAGHHDADGRVMVDARCTAGCGNEHTYSDWWNPPLSWTDPEGEKYEHGRADSVLEFEPGWTGERHTLDEIRQYIAQSEDDNDELSAAYWRGHLAEHEHQAEPNGEPANPAPTEGLPTTDPDCNWCDAPATQVQHLYHHASGGGRHEHACDEHAAEHFWKPGPVELANGTHTAFDPEPAQPVLDWSHMNKAQQNGGPTDPTHPPGQPASPIPHQNGEHPMSAQALNAEITSLPSAIAYFRGTAAAASLGPTNNETVIASLSGFEIGEARLQKVALLNEAQMRAAALAEELAKDFEGDMPLREHFQANPDAGSKQFNLNG